MPSTALKLHPMTTQVCGQYFSPQKNITTKITEVTETLKSLPQMFLESKKLQKCAILLKVDFFQ
jgi:hypothetical protein